MLNRYSKLPKVDIRSSQALTDLSIVDGALQRQQKSYDETATNAAKFQSEVTKLQGYGDAAKQYISQIDEDVKNTIASVANQDLGSPEVKNKLNGYVQSIYGDKKLQEIQKVNQLRGQYEEQLQDLDSKGKLHSNQKLLQDMAWEKYSKTGQVSPELTQPLYEAADLVSERGKLVSMIKASGSDGIAFLKDGTAYKNSSKGISDSRISNAVKEQLLTYANSHAGRQEATDYKAMVATGQIDPKKMSFDNYLLGQVMSTAKNYSFSDYSTNMDGALNSSKKDKEAKEKEEAYTGEGYIPAMESSKKVELDSDGRININPALDLMDWLTGSDSRSEDELKLEKTLQTGANKAGMDIKSYVERINSDPNIKVSYYNTKKSEEASQRFFNPKSGGGEFFTRKIYSQEYPQGISAKEFMKEKGLSEEEMKGGFTVIGDVHADNPYTPKGFSSMINGEPIVIDDSYSLKDSSQQDIFDMNQAKYSGSGTHEFTRTKGNETYKFTSMYNPKTESVELVSREKVK